MLRLRERKVTFIRYKINPKPKEETHEAEMRASSRNVYKKFYFQCFFDEEFILWKRHTVLNMDNIVYCKKEKKKGAT